MINIEELTEEGIKGFFYSLFYLRIHSCWGSWVRSFGMVWVIK